MDKRKAPGKKDDASAKEGASSSSAASSAPVVIKKYANRRLYNTATSSYVTLDYLCGMVKEGTEFTVCDAKTGEDITRSVLTQIIVEEEAKGQNLLPISFLRQLISFYGDNLQYVVPGYLDYMMQNFCTNQDQLRHNLEEALGGFSPFSQFEEMSKQNLAMFQEAMTVFSPFSQKKENGGNLENATAASGKATGNTGNTTGNTTGDAAAEDDTEKIQDLEGCLSEIQKRLDELSSK
ncbi:MAG: polyhydroxyalkanoate synthesis repressor PhaR [Alphaproteobacteria bacterium]|nr:polyhydroxyalkanoate synthesis repressor PhaR [Alphaproteobacteria bacterium]